MFDRLTRIFRPTRTRSYDAAGQGRRWSGAGTTPVSIAAMLSARRPMAERARYLVGSNALAASGAEAWVSGLVGCGIKPQSAHPVPEIRASINAAWDRWTETADFDGVADFYGLQGTAARRMVIDGDVFAGFHLGGRGPVPLQVKLIDAEQIVSTLTQPTANGGLIVNGVEVDERGRRVGFHLYRNVPGMPFTTNFDWVRVPADDVIQMFAPTTPGQVRGVSWFAPVLLRLADLDKAHDAQLVRQQIAAMLAGFIIDPNSTAGGFEGEPRGSTLDGGLEPGTLKVLDPGQDIRFSEPATIGAESIDFLKLTAREIAVGLGLPYVLLAGDLADVNLSSIRHGLLDFRRRCEAHQHNVIVFQLLRPVWRRFMTIAALTGAIDARGFERDPEAFMAVSFIPPKNPLADPLKDTQADVEAIAAGLMSRRQAVAARGYDLEDLDREIAADHRAAAAHGLDFTTALSPAGTALAALEDARP